MKRINEYKKLFSIENDIDLKQLKSAYRGLVKEWHPDKFPAGDPKAEEAELMSRQIIDGYHFLVSIAPETKESTKEEYENTIAEEGISDYRHKGLRLEVTFTDGSVYEYFGVTKNVFQKFMNSDKQLRFAKRNIFHTFLYRKAKKADLQVA